MVDKLNENKNPQHSTIKIFKSDGDVQVEVALQYNDTYVENVESYVNVINTVNGGTHLTGFRMALTRAINDYGTSSTLVFWNTDFILLPVNFLISPHFDPHPFRQCINHT